MVDLQILSIKITVVAVLITVAILILGKKKSGGESNLKCTFNSHPDGIVFGLKGLRKLYLPRGKESNIICFGTSGSGKTSSVLLPTIMGWTGPLFCIDVAGDISQALTAAGAKNLLIFDPSAEDGISYDVFDHIDKMQDPDDRDEALEQLAYLIMPQLKNSSANADFFNDSGRKILAAGLMAFYAAGNDFSECCEKIATMSYVDLFREIGNSGHSRANAYINSFRGTNEMNTAGCYSACADAIKLFATNTAVKNALRRPDLWDMAVTPSACETHKVIIRIPEPKLDLYAPLVRIILSQCLSYFSDRPLDANEQILYCIDEISAFGKLDQLPSALARLRKRKINLLLLTQNLSDLDAIYGRETRCSMVGNCKYIFILGINDPDTQEHFAKQIGKSEKHGFWISKSSEEKHEHQDYIVPPAEMGKLKDKLIVIGPNGYRYLRKNFYFKKWWQIF